MFEGFTTARVETLLPHDHPETSAMWQKWRRDWPNASP